MIKNRIIPFLSVIWVAIVLLAMPSIASANGGVAVGITIAPPPLLVYSQPVCPGEGYIWIPGYWAYADDGGYYWVPGTWVEPPAVGLLWTPGYWAFGDGVYGWHAGFWGPTVGFYGGINYGFGYFGTGYVGGRWDHDRFFYNTTVNNVNTTIIHNTYNTTVVNNRVNVNHTSFNGGPRGTTARPTSAELAAAREHNQGPSAAQVQQERSAASNRAQFASENRGKSAVMATEKPGDFRGHGVVNAKMSTPRTPNEVRSNEAPNRTENARPAPETNRSRSRPSPETSRPESRPAPNREAAPPRESKPAPAPKRESAPKEMKPNATPKHEAAPPKEYKPSPAPKHEAAPKETKSTNAPKDESVPKGYKPSAAPKHEAAPKEAKSSPAPKHEAAPPKEAKSSAPKEERPAPAPKHEAAPHVSHQPAPAERSSEKQKPSR